MLSPCDNWLILVKVMNTKQVFVCNVHFNDVTAKVKDEKDNLICFPGKVISPEIKIVP